MLTHNIQECYLGTMQPHPLNKHCQKDKTNLLAKAHADLLGDVHAKGVDDVTEEVHVEDALAIPVVDVADLLDSCGRDRTRHVLGLAYQTAQLTSL